MTVYVVHEVVDAIRGAPIHDTTSAEEFGERRVLVRTKGRTALFLNRKGHVERRARMLAHDPDFLREAVDAIRDGLVDYTRDDYLVPIGAPELIAAASVVAARRSGGHLRLLLWTAGCYDPIVLDGLWSEERRKDDVLFVDNDLTFPSEDFERFVEYSPNSKESGEKEPPP